MAVLGGLGSVGTTGPLSGGGGFGAAGGAGPHKNFGEVLTQAIERADNTMVNANTAVNDLVSGKAVSSHEVMIQLEEANLALQWTVQLRNRALEAYQEIMRMPL
ncbi:MAG: flagellar hook-basal body complex protein FliE [Elusimicrobia bacterium]|jgi:flagellar hook-basal body complex protein FliE|nr:flagellar hook-basal body complex protein FliE [Elusimicrobiota bacterium]